MAKIISLIIAWGLIATSSYAFEGTYDVKGFDPYNKMPYEGTVTIKKDKNGVYQAHWLLTEDGKQYNDIGTGIKFDGDRISFVFKNVQEGDDEGIQLYTRKDNNTLEGPFTLLKKNLVGKETLTRH